MKRPVTVDASSLRHQVKLANQAQPGTRQPFGAAQPQAQSYATVRASIVALQGRDIYQATQFVSDVSHTVTIRYRPGVNAGDQVLYGQRVFRIQAALNPEERNIRLDLLCLEVNDGNQPVTTY